MCQGLGDVLRLVAQGDAPGGVEDALGPVSLPAHGHKLVQRIGAVGRIHDNDLRLFGHAPELLHVHDAVGTFARDDRRVNEARGVAAAGAERRGLGAFRLVFLKGIGPFDDAQAEEVADLALEDAVGIFLAYHFAEVRIVEDVAAGLGRHDGDVVAVDFRRARDLERGHRVEEVPGDDARIGERSRCRGRKRGRALRVAFVQSGAGVAQRIADLRIAIERKFLAHRFDGRIEVFHEANRVGDIGHAGHLAALRERHRDRGKRDIAVRGRCRAFGQRRHCAGAGEAGGRWAEEGHAGRAAAGLDRFLGRVVLQRRHRDGVLEELFAEVRLDRIANGAHINDAQGQRREVHAEVGQHLMNDGRHDGDEEKGQSLRGGEGGEERVLHGGWCRWARLGRLVVN